ncbi:MAG: pimeloyl-CoA dehydrogenase large subunit [Ramlibacter sp.]|jgi:alkylation response protein AidB-like acyl-CoA dehydrogenase|nr:pimeloyl-CoA dehydrogenase large subunit [Ramlibacter sp.]
MNLKPTSEETAFRTEVRDFVRTNLAADICERVVGLRRVGRDDYVRWQRTLNERGWAAPGWPVEHGGTGWDAARRVIFEEECFAGGAPRQMPFGLSMVGPVIYTFGTPQQKQRYLPRILRSEDWWCQGYSEPGAGSDLASLKTRAERVGNKYVVNGQKIWTSFAQWANLMFCLVRTAVDVKAQEGISFLLIDMNSPGITVRPIKTLDGSHDVNEVFLENVEVPVENLVGEQNKGWTYAKFLLVHERSNIAGIGMCKRLLTRLKDVALRETSRGRPLIESSRFRERIARIEIELLAHEWSLLRLVSAENEGRPVGAEASVLKVRGSELQGDLARLLMDAVGPGAIPYSEELLATEYAGPRPGPDYAEPLGGVYFDMRKVAIYGGTNEVQKNIIAKIVLGL